MRASLPDIVDEIVRLAVVCVLSCGLITLALAMVFMVARMAISLWRAL